MPSTLRVCSLALGALLILGFPASLQGQVPGLPQPTAPPAAEEVAQPAPDSPFASMRAFLEAADATRWPDAARYLSLDNETRTRGPELAARLKGVIDSRRLIDFDTLSRDSAGHTDDRLPAGLDQVAVVTIDGVAEPMRLTRRSDADGTFWAFSPATVGHIDDWYASLPDRWVRDLLVRAGLRSMLGAGPLGILWWQWVALPFVAFLSWIVGRVIRIVFWPICVRLTVRTPNAWDNRVFASIGRPLTLAFAILAFAIGASWLQLTRSAFLLVGSVLKAGMVFALFWGLWRSTDVIIAWILSRSWAQQNASARNLLTIGSNVFRALVFVIGILAIVAALGYPVGTVLAGLGIGGLALAFGAQKTVENMIGSFALALDQPFRVGDFVQVENFVGTVEHVGLRSTRIRTLDRSVITIPNGKLSEQRLESLEARDRMRLATTISLTYDTTRSELEAVLEGLERVLRAHPDIWPDSMVVRLEKFAPNSIDIEVMAWFKVPTWTDFQRCRQEALLGFMRAVEDAGATFANPSRTLRLARAGGADPQEPPASGKSGL
jgi:MscS family membrane protein